MGFLALPKEAEVTTVQPSKVTLKEFKMWLEGLLSGNDSPRDLPSLDQWRKVLAMIERIGEDQKPSYPVYVMPPIPTPVQPSVQPFPSNLPNVYPTAPKWIGPYPTTSGTTTVTIGSGGNGSLSSLSGCQQQYTLTSSNLSYIGS